MTTKTNPLQGWQIDRSQLKFAGTDLQCPERVLAEKDGTLWSTDARGGVMRINADGTQQLIGQVGDTPLESMGEGVGRNIPQSLPPHGLCFAPNGDFIVANSATRAVNRLTRAGENRILYTEIDGRPLGRIHSILRDSRGRFWLTVTTRTELLGHPVNEERAEGYIALIDERGIRIVADGLIGVQEARMDADERWLYVAETPARRICRLRVRDDGSLDDREIHGPAELQGQPNGCAFDAFGNLWMTYALHDIIAALTPDGEELILLDDSRPSSVWMSGLTFGGPDLSYCYIGSARGRTLPWFTSPLPGLPLIHWNETFRL